jgi:general secretion pathway protein H
MKKTGFTLLEMTIVLLLASLILGLSTVFFAGWLPSARFDATAREIAGLIRHARSLARLNMETQRVVIDLDQRTYGLEGKTTKEFPPHVLISVVDPVAGEILQGKYPLVFYPAGGMAGGDIILSGGKKKLRINMDPITGAVLIRDS